MVGIASNDCLLVVTVEWIIATKTMMDPTFILASKLSSVLNLKVTPLMLRQDGAELEEKGRKRGGGEVEAGLYKIKSRYL